VASSSETAVIAVRDLAFSYPRTSFRAVSGMTFEVSQGEIFGFLGPSGAGKSTTQRILIRLLDGWTGEVQVLGRPARSWGDDYFEHIGVCFESPNHHSKLTASENLTFYASLYTGETAEPADLLAAVGLAEHAGVRVGRYSKGMRTRLSVARALLNRPSLLFLDEPTSGLDPVNARLVRDLVRSEQERGATVFLTTHDMRTADELCDRVAFVVDGQIAALDRPKDLRLARSARRVRVDYATGDRTVTRDFDLDGLADDPDFQGLLRAGGIRAMHTLEASLDDVFAEVTGRWLL
jgi:fluoroquinolone transport system ATP-binding protein